MINNNRVYLDFASQTETSQKVLEEMQKIQKKNFNPVNLYNEGLVAENILTLARQKIAKVLGVIASEIYFTQNATLSCAAAIFGTVNFYKNSHLGGGNKPHIITSNIEHPAVLENIKYLEKIGEIEASYIETDEWGMIKVSEVIKQIKKNTILISIIYVNNEVGTIQDIKNIAKGIQAWKKENQREVFSYPYFHTDASQAGNYLSLYIQRLGVDMLSLNGSKIYGPKSSALLFKKEHIKISPFYFGGGQERGLFSGTVDIEKCFGLAVALEEAQFKLQVASNKSQVEIKRNNLLQNILKKIPEAKLIGIIINTPPLRGTPLKEGKDRLPNNLSLHLPNFPSDEMVLRLDQRGFAVSAGSACSAKEGDYSLVIFNIMKNKHSLQQAKKIARETIRITIDTETKEKDLQRFASELQDIYYRFKKNS